MVIFLSAEGGQGGDVMSDDDEGLGEKDIPSEAVEGVTDLMTAAET